MSVVRPSSLTFHIFYFSWNRWTDFNVTWEKARSQRPSTKFVFFGPIGKTRWSLWLLIRWDIFKFSSENTGRNSTKFDGKQGILFPKFVFSDQSEKQDGRPGLSLTDILPLKPLDGIQLKLTGSKISLSFSKFVFLGRSVNINGYPGWSIKKVAHCTPLHCYVAFCGLLFSFLFQVFFTKSKSWFSFPLASFIHVIMNSPLYTALTMNPPCVRLLIPNIFGYNGILQLSSVFQQWHNIRKYVWGSQSN